MASSADVKATAQGHLSGSRRTCRPLQFTVRLGRQRTREPTARDRELFDGMGSPETGGPAKGSCASTAQESQAAFAKNWPERQCSSSAPSFRSRIANSILAWSRWNVTSATEIIQIIDESICYLSLDKRILRTRRQNCNTVGK